MTRSFRPLLVGTVLTLAAAVAGPCLRAQDAPKTFYPATDAAPEIDAAFTAARADGKYVLLDFGADWCPDCRVLGTLFDDPTVAPFVHANFHVVRIDVGRRDKNDDLVKQYGATSGDWIPAVVVLNPARQAVATTDDKVRLTRHTTPGDLLSLLKDWAPKKAVSALGSFEQSGVRVDLRLDRDGSGGEWLTAVFTPERPDAHLYATELPPHGVDGLGRPTLMSVRSAEGLAVMGHLVADRPVAVDVLEALHVSLPVYPPGPVTLRLPVRVERGAHAEVSVSYMTCGGLGCQPPVADKRVSVTLDALPVPGR